jgi:hypothetical protein
MTGMIKNVKNAAINTFTTFIFWWVLLARITRPEMKLLA